MQPFLYCLANPGTRAWASKYGFQAMQDLVHCPSYVRTLVPFTVPANPNLPPALSKLTSKVELSSVSLLKSRAIPGSQDSLALHRQMLLDMLGNAVTTTPDKSPPRRLSRKQAPLADSRSGMNFGNESSSVASSSVKVVDPAFANTRANSRKPATVIDVGATFNPSQHRVTTRVLLSAWCLPIESSVALRQHNAAVLLGAADAYIFDSPDNEETTVSQRFSRKAFVQQLLRKSLSVLAHIGAFRLAESRLFTSDPAAKDLPFDPLWLTLPALVSMAWCVNVLTTTIKNNQVTSYLLDWHRIARAMDPIEEAFFPAYVPAFFHNAAIIQAIRSGSFTSGHCLLAMDHLSDFLTPFHFIASVDNTGAVVIPSSGLSVFLHDHHCPKSWFGCCTVFLRIQRSTLTFLRTRRRSCFVPRLRVFSCK